MSPRRACVSRSNNPGHFQGRGPSTPELGGQFGTPLGHLLEHLLGPVVERLLGSETREFHGIYGIFLLQVFASKVSWRSASGICGRVQCFCA